MTNVTDYDGTRLANNYKNHLLSQSKVGTQTVKYTYDTCNRLTAEVTRDKSGNLLADYAYIFNGNGQKVETGESSYNFYLSDGHGDVRQLTDETGAVTDSYRYNSYGELEETQGETENPYLYTGEYFDEGTGLYYLRARYMNPETGTFTSMDTYRGNSYDPASLHRYTYAQNNPQMYNDPSGHSAVGLFLQQRHNAMLMGTLCGMVARIINDLLGRPIDPALAYATGAVIGLSVAGMAGAYIGMTVIQVLSMLGTVMQMHFTAESAAELVTLLAYGVTGNNPDLLRDTVWAAMSLLSNCLLLGLCMKISFSGPRGNVSLKSGSSQNMATYYEYKALRQQGYSASEVFELIKQFRNGINPNNEFVYHFTTMKGGEGITAMQGIIGTKFGVAGPGIYAGTTPTPSWLLKHIPFSGWGLGNTPVRIAIKLTSSMKTSKPLIPIKTVIIEVDFLGF